MSSESEDTSLLFGVIPSFLRKPEQVARWLDLGELPTYTLLREPMNMEELNKYGHAVAIWRDNDTLTYLSPSGYDYHPYPSENERTLSLNYFEKGPKMYVVGKTDEAIAQTASFFMELEEPTEESCSINIYSSSRTFDFRAAGSQCLTRMFEAAPSRHLFLTGLTLSAEQSVVLATRPHPTQLELHRCMFEDEGTTFVNALQNRLSPYGSLIFLTSPFTGLSNDNLKRMLRQVEMIEHLNISRVADEIALLPFSAQVGHLLYEISSSSLLKADLQLLKVVTNKLYLGICHEDDTDPTELLVSIWRRVADLGHFVELEISLYGDSWWNVDSSVVQEVVLAIRANRSLKALSLCSSDRNLNWDPHVQTLVEVLKDHKQLCTFTVDVCDDAWGPNYSHLRRLLSLNRNITVKNDCGEIYSDGSSIDELYSLNAFYRGSADLTTEPPPERPSLVMTALVERASNDFQRSALLLSNHVDVLCELVQFAKLDELSEDSSRSSLEGNTLKRRRRIQPPRLAKRMST